MVKNPLCNARDKGSIPGRGTQIPHAAEQLSLFTVTTTPMSATSLHTARKILHDTMKVLHAATKTQCNRINN